MRRFYPILLVLSMFISTVGQTGNVYRFDSETNRVGNVPSELIGEWQARRGSGSSYYNPNSGSYGSPNGTIDSYKFFADGR